MVDEDVAPDFAVALVRSEGRWEVLPLPPRVGSDLDSFVGALTAQEADDVALAVAAYGDDFFLLLRSGARGVRMLLSDAAASEDWPIADEVLDELDVPLPDEDDDEPLPAGDLSILADLGVPALDLSVLCTDDELYPDEALARIAARLGVSPDYDRVLDAVLG